MSSSSSSTAPTTSEIVCLTCYSVITLLAIVMGVVMIIYPRTCQGSGRSGSVGRPGKRGEQGAPGAHALIYTAIRDDITTYTPIEGGAAQYSVPKLGASHDALFNFVNLEQVQTGNVVEHSISMSYDPLSTGQNCSFAMELQSSNGTRLDFGGNENDTVTAMVGGPSFFTVTTTLVCTEYEKSTQHGDLDVVIQCSNPNIVINTPLSMNLSNVNFGLGIIPSYQVTVPALAALTIHNQHIAATTTH